MAIGIQYAVFEYATFVAQGPVLAEGAQAVSGTSAETGVLYGAGTAGKAYYVRLCTDTACMVTWGAPTQDAQNDGSDGRYLPANVPEYFWILAAEYELSVITPA